MCTCLNYGH